MNSENFGKLRLILKRFRAEEDGQDLVEYALLLCFLGLVAVASLHSVGTSVTGLLSTFLSVTTAHGAWTSGS